MEDCELSNEYTLTKADPQEFAIYETVYGDKGSNKFAVKNWDLRLAVSIDNPFAKGDNYFWINHGKLRIGGVLLEPNVISRLFFIPPFESILEVMKLLKNLLTRWSDTTNKIYAYQISAEQTQYFEMIGFWFEKSIRWMMRPTEIFDVNWDDTLIIKTPDASDRNELAKLFYESFKNDIDDYNYTNQHGEGRNYEDYLNEINIYFKREPIDKLLEASTLVYDNSGKLVGACLISLFEEWPLVYDICVHPSQRGKQIATKMLRKALTALYKEYPVLRLFVALGNTAELVYYNTGFVLGNEIKSFYIPASKS